MLPVSPTLFRVLDVLSLVLVLLGSLVDPFFMRSIHVAHSASVPFINPAFVALLGALNLGIGIVSTIGLYAFRRWSRPLAVLGVALGALIYPMCSYFAISGVTTAIDFIAFTAGGATLALAYFSPIARRFEPN